MDLKTLYRTVIMDNYKNPKNKGLVKGDDYHFVHLNNPSCGDDMNVEIIEDELLYISEKKKVRHDPYRTALAIFNYIVKELK